jgi:hypothetical protein
MLNKKEIIRQYKQTIQPMGIYQIKNLSNGKIYLDSSKNLQGAQNSAQFQLNLGTYMNHSLQADYKQFGESRFVFEILDRLTPKDDPAYDYTDDLATLKSMWLDKLQPYNEIGYNSPAQ